MRGVAIGMQKTDGDGFHSVGLQRPGGGAHGVEVQRNDGVAIPVHAFRHFQPVAAGHQRIGVLQEQVVDVVALLGPHLQDVAEALRGDQAQFRPAPLDQRVGDQRGAVDDIADIGQPKPGGADDFRQPGHRPH